MRAASDTMVVMSKTPQYGPYDTLGKHLRYLREQQQESLAEVSGAVEIDEQALERIEYGQERPAEEILLLLISHFNMQDQEAVQLWELAGYDNSNDNAPLRPEELLQDAIGSNKPVLVVVGMDARTIYTDSVAIDTGDAGITMQFGQQSSKKQQQTIAKLGMSYDQAEKVLHELQLALLRGRHGHQPKQLPPAIDQQ